MPTGQYGDADEGRTGRALNLGPIFGQRIDFQFKAFPAVDHPVTIGSVGEQGWNALKPPFSTPVMVIKETALQHNIELMADYCSAHLVSLAPHVKTPLSPQIAQRQLAAGAWGLTVANVHQARLFAGLGTERIFIANEVIDPASAESLCHMIRENEKITVYCLIDSVEGAMLLDDHLAKTGLRRRVPVLIELGIPGARCGCRGVEEGRHLGRVVKQMKHLQIVGVETYENLFTAETAEETARNIDQLFERLRRLAAVLDAEGLFRDTPEVLVSAGGSMWFDRAVAKLTDPWGISRPVRTIIRAGSYVVHDGAQYRKFSPLDGRSAGGPKLEQALELWATVISRPERDLAVLNFGKRDAAHDRGFPLPFAARTKDCIEILTRDTFEITSLSDQHARLRLPAVSPLAVGDMVGSYISHPCTSFDNWRLVPLANDEYDVVGAIRSYL
jgi:D-serine dehydratase